VADDRLIYRLRASSDQLRAQMALARLSEVPADKLPSEPAVSPDAVGDGAAEGSPEGEPAPAAAGPAPGTVLRFR
jgi:hypothetical protein